MKKVVYNACSKSSDLCSQCAFKHYTEATKNWIELLDGCLERIIEVLETQAETQCLYYDPDFLFSCAQELKSTLLPWD